MVFSDSSVVLLNFTGFAQDAMSLHLSWVLPPTPPNIEDIVDHYIIEVTTLQTSKVTTYFSVQLQATVTDLHPYYSYSCRVAAFTTFINLFTQPIVIQTHEAGEKQFNYS